MINQILPVDRQPNPIEPIHRGAEVEAPPRPFEDVMRQAIHDSGNGGEASVPQATAPVHSRSEIQKQVAGDQSAGDDLAAKIKKLLQGENTDEISVDEQALSFLEKSMVAAGYDKAQISRMLKSLKDNAGPGGVKLSDLLKGIEDLDQDVLNKETTNTGFAAMSIPYLETILARFGLDKEDIKEVINGGTLKGEDLDLLTVASKIDALSAEKNSGQQFFPGDPDHTELQLMMDKAGIKKRGPLSLNNFAAELRKMADKQHAEKTVDQNIENFAKRLKKGDKKGNGKEAALPLVAAKLTPGAAKNIPGLESSANAQAGALADGATGLLSSGGSQGQFNFSDNGDNFASNLKAATAGAGDVKADGESAASFDRLVKDMVTAGGAAKAAEARPQGRPLPSHILDQVSKQLARSINNKQNEVMFHIKPATLGRLQMSIENTKSGLKVSILAEQGSTKDVLATHATELRADLVEQGFKVDTIDVEVPPDFDRAMADTRQEAGKREGRSNRDTEIGETQPNGEVSAGTVDGGTKTGRDGVLDLVA